VSVFAVPQPASVSLAVAGSAARFPVRRIYCVGRNYVDHIREMKEADERDPPFFFQKPTDAIVEDGGTVPYPSITDDLQYEVELVIAIGQGGVDIPLERALDHIHGYAIGLDMTRRDRQRESGKKGLPWEIGKSFDHSAPCGPVHPVAAVGHKMQGRLSLAVNGAVKQDSELAKMIWNVPEIVANLSAQYRLVPGDLIYTGTPAGVTPVKPGDELVGAIDGLGTLTIRIGEREQS
jgi:fumarylpyruvate hydrolase